MPNSLKNYFSPKENTQSSGKKLKRSRSSPENIGEVRWKVVAWHPEVATQLSLASEEDSNPVVQLWDLRFATAPVKSFHGHNRGVLTLAWCAQDPDFLVSSGKDNKILCWNPNSQEPVSSST
uniref:WD_REPEATS_REGION domain-containing protein n=1 Tax=Rhodnius prolixus TaxID=13249 RepID=T1I2H9_RHOPR